MTNCTECRGTREMIHGFWEKATQSKTAMGTVHHKQARGQQAGGPDPEVLQDGASLLKAAQL